MKKAHVTRRDIAEHFGVSERCVDNWRTAGKLPQPIKFGTAQQARVRWPLDVVPLLEAALRGEPIAP